MTIHVTIKNEDSRPNAVVEVIVTDEYRGMAGDRQLFPTTRRIVNQKLLAGGENTTVMLCSSSHIEIIERRNDQ